MRFAVAIAAVFAACPAWGWEAAALVPLHGVAGARGAVPLTWGGAAAIAWYGDGGVVVRPVGGGPELAIPGPTVGVVARDFDGDGADDLVRCGSDGLVVVRAADPRPRPLATAPCAAVAGWIGPDGGPALVVVAADGAVVPWTGSDRGITAGADVARVPGTPLLASWGRVWAVASAGAPGIAIHGPDGESTVATGPVDALGYGPAGWSWTSAGHLRELGGGDVALPGPIAWGALEGLPGMVVAAPDDLALHLWGRGGWSRLAVPIRPDRIAVADLDRDGCAEVLVTSDEGDGAWITGRCGSASDALAPTPEPPPPDPPGETSAPAAGIAAAPPPEPPPSRIALDRAWTSLRVPVGQRIDIQLVGPDGTARIARRGGPPGLILTPEGRLVYVPVASEIGTWRVELRVRQGASHFWTGIDLEIH